MNRRLLLLTIIVALSFGARLWLAAAPVIPQRQALADFPRRLGDWQMETEGSVPDRQEGILGADDYILRAYRNGAGQRADLFVAYYKAQTTGAGPHSPKNCLPGSGWEPIESDRIELGRDPDGRPLRVNHYVVEKDRERALVLYWFQARGRVVASEYWGLAYLIWDAFHRGRRDGALVRITVPLRGEEEGSASLNVALDFAHTTLPELPRFLPN